MGNERSASPKSRSFTQQLPFIAMDTHTHKKTLPCNQEALRWQSKASPGSSVRHPRSSRPALPGPGCRRTEERSPFLPSSTGRPSAPVSSTIPRNDGVLPERLGKKTSALGPAQPGASNLERRRAGAPRDPSRSARAAPLLRGTRPAPRPQPRLSPRRRARPGALPGPLPERESGEARPLPPPPVAPGGTEKARCGRQGRAPLPLPPHLLQGGHQQPPPLGRVLLAEELVEQRLRLHGAAGPGPLGAAGRAGRAGLGAEEGRGGRAGRPSPGGPAAPRRRRQARSGGGRRRLPHSPPGSRWSPRGAAEVWGRRERGHAARRAGREGRGRAPGARAPPPPRSPSSPSSPARLAAAEHARRRPAPRLRGSSGAVAAAAASCTAEVTSRRRSAPAPLWGCPWAVRERVGCSAVGRCGTRIAVRRCGREITP